MSISLLDEYLNLITLAVNSIALAIHIYHISVFVYKHEQQVKHIRRNTEVCEHIEWQTKSQIEKASDAASDEHANQLLKQ